MSTDSTLTPEQVRRLEALRKTLTEQDHRAIASDWRAVGDDMRKVMADIDRTPRIPPHVDAWLQDRYRDHPRRVAVELRSRPRVPRRRVVRAWGLGELAAIVLTALAIVGAFTVVNWVVTR